MRDAPNVERQALIAKKDAVLSRAKRELAAAEETRSSILRRMQSAPKKEAELDAQDPMLTAELFNCDRVITGWEILRLRANVDLLLELVADSLEMQLLRASPSEWDTAGREIKVLVFELSMLEKQVKPFQGLPTDDPEAARTEGIDYDELRLLETHIIRIADSLDLGSRKLTSFGKVRSRLAQFLPKLSIRKWRREFARGLSFCVGGSRLMSQDLTHAMKLVMKMGFLNYTLEPTEVQVCTRAVKDLIVLIPFVIVAIIPLSPPGHVLVFSLIMKVWPDFFPSPFTQRRQNVMRIYDEIKPASERRRRKAWMSRFR
jgi:hypothetical protein